jgi:hypothetical protein
MTPYTKEATIVYVGILVQSRVLPLAWCVMPQQESWDEGQWEILDRLFEQIAAHVSLSDCTLLADSGLSCLKLIELCTKWKWHYVLRIEQDEWVQQAYRHYFLDWKQCNQIITKEGDHWYGRVKVWQKHSYEVWLSACWEPGCDGPWFLLSDQKASHKRVSEYKLRMRVESTFQDTKSRLLEIECSQFTNRDHLHRWLFAIFLSLWWIAHLGTSCVHHGHREQIDRKDRRDKGLLRIGCLWFHAILKRVRRDLCPKTLSRIKAQLANCLPFSHRNQRLCFSIYLS